MKYVLDMKDFCQKYPYRDEKDYNERFYRYCIVNEQGELFAIVWFAQQVDSGNIYSVSVSLKKEYLRDCFDIYIKNGDEGRDYKNRSYYPERFEMSVSSERLTTDNFQQHIDALAEGYSIAHTIMEIFEDEEHQQYRRNKR